MNKALRCQLIEDFMLKGIRLDIEECCWLPLSRLAALALEWTALEDPDAATENERFGRILAQTADAET